MVPLPEAWFKFEDLDPNQWWRNRHSCRHGVRSQRVYKSHKKSRQNDSVINDCQLNHGKSPPPPINTPFIYRYDELYELICNKQDTFKGKKTRNHFLFAHLRKR